jgi:hypothetical protein
MNLSSPTNQCLTMVLAALSERRSECTKQNALDHIRSLRWFDFTKTDDEPYPSEKSTEPRWSRLIAFARDEARRRGFLLNATRFDHWRISDAGIAELNSRIVAFQSGIASVHSCFLWSRVFKEHVDPKYLPGGDDKRPRNFYKDVERELIAEAQLRD